MIFKNSLVQSAFGFLLDHNMQSIGSILHFALLAVFLNFFIFNAEAKHRSNGIADERVELLQQKSRHNFLIGIAGVAVQKENKSECGRQLETMLDDILHKKHWTIKLLDSFGTSPESFSWGNFFWMPSQDLCDDLNEPYSITFSELHAQETSGWFNGTSPFPLRYTVVYMNFTTPHYIDLKLPFENLIHLGLCLPAPCSSSNLLRYADAFFKSGKFEMQQDFEIEMQGVLVRTPEFKWEIFQHTGSVVFIGLCILTFLLTILAELVHKSKLNLWTQQKLHKKPTSIDKVTEVPAKSASVIISTVEFERPKDIFMMEQLLLCFRWKDNWKRILKLGDEKHSIGVISGLRTIVCLWVTVFHAYYYALYAISNVPLIFAKLENFILQPILQACFYVDVFFVMSAFLLVYKFLCNESQLQKIRTNSLTQNVKLFLKMLSHRYMRFTPVLIISMLLSDMIYDLLNTYTPFRLDEHSGIACKRNWWYNLLYIQNFLSMKDICCSWSWYLSCEMQFFIIFTALLFVYAKNEKFAKIIYTALAVASLIVGWICNYRNRITFQIDVIYSTLDQLYIAPWVRIVPYIGGAGLGWLLHYIQHRHPELERQKELKEYSHATSIDHSHHKHVDHSVDGFESSLSLCRGVIWIFCSILYITTNFMSYFRHTPSWLVAVIMSFGKLVFALFVPGVIIILCTLGYCRPLNALLSARIFLFLNKFCFSIYMIAPLIVIGSLGLRNMPTIFTYVGSGKDSISFVLLSIAAAFLLVLFVELPWTRVTNLLLKRQKQIDSKR